jgi:hypothetical protein
MNGVVLLVRMKVGAAQADVCDYGKDRHRWTLAASMDGTFKGRFVGVFCILLHFLRSYSCSTALEDL